MSLAYSESPAAEPTLATTGNIGADEIRTQVWALLGAQLAQQAPFERRRDHRYAFSQLMTIHPLAADGQTATDETMVAAAKHLSERGVGFFHPHPLTHRRVIVVLEAKGTGSLGFLLDVSWCRFMRQGWYESGGRFLQAVAAPPLGRQAAAS